MLSYSGLGKKGMVDVEYIGHFGDEGEFDEDDLALCVRSSGFESLSDWLAAAGDSRYLYRVKLLSVTHARIEDFSRGKA